MQSNSISYLFWAEERRVDQLSIIWNQRHSVKGQVVMAVLRERKHIYKEVPFYYFIESKTGNHWNDSRWSIHLFFDQPLCCYLSLYRYNHSNVLDPDPKVIILVISRFFEEKTESVWCFSTFYQKVHLSLLKLIMIMFYLSWIYIEKDRFSPIDVNMPDLKGMLLVWKPTGPENTSQYYIIKIKIINI